MVELLLLLLLYFGSILMSEVSSSCDAEPMVVKSLSFRGSKMIGKTFYGLNLT